MRLAEMYVFRKAAGKLSNTFSNKNPFFHSGYNSRLATAESWESEMRNCSSLENISCQQDAVQLNDINEELFTDHACKNLKEI